MSGRFTVYNRIVSEETFAKILPENLKLANDFLDYLKAIDRAASTIRQYENDLHIFFAYNAEQNGNKRFTEISKREFANFQSYALTEWKWSSNRIRRVKSVLSSLSNYIECMLDEEEEYAGHRPVIRKIASSVLEPCREKTIITDKEVQTVLDELISKEKYQCACAFALASFSGSRKSELLRFKVRYFDDENIMKDAALYKTPEKIVTKGRGSKGKSLYKYTLLDFKKYFDLWMAERSKLGIESEMLLVNRNGQPLSVGALDEYAKYITDILGKPFYFHSLRHQLCTRLFKIGIPANIIQEFFGWSNLEMTNIYNDSDSSDFFGKYFTKDGLKGENNDGRFNG